MTQSTEAEIDYSGTILKVNDRTAGTDFSTGVGQLNYQSLFMDTDIKFRSTNYSMDETRLKLLAGDSDIDIYIISASEIPSFIENGFYTPFESEVIDEYISQCHEMLQEYSYRREGSICACFAVHSGNTHSKIGNRGNRSEVF